MNNKMRIEDKPNKALRGARHEAVAPLSLVVHVYDTSRILHAR